MSEMHSTTKTLRIGSVSSGTLKEMDLVDAFLGALEEVDSDRYFQIRDDEYSTLLEACQEYGDDEMMTIERARLSANNLIDYLADILNDYVPDFCAFDTLEGDGAEYGVWVDEDALQHGIYEGDILVVDDAPDFPLAGDYTHALVVNDHGNRTLYTARGTICWEVV